MLGSLYFYFVFFCMLQSASRGRSSALAENNLQHVINPISFSVSSTRQNQHFDHMLFRVGH